MINRKPVRWGVFGLTLVVLAAGAYWLLNPASESPVSRAAADTSQTRVERMTTPVISPDGRTVVYAADGRLYAREAEGGLTRVLTDTGAARLPFWSPDGRWVGYFEAGEGKLKIVSIMDASSRVVCALPHPDAFAGAVWTTGGVIVVSQAHHGLYRVAASGGPITRTQTLDFAGGERWYLAPSTLPDGKTLVIGLMRDDGFALAVLRNGVVRTVLKSPSGVMVDQPVYSPSGHLLFNRSAEGVTDVWAVPFDLASLKTTGDPFPVCREASSPSVSRSGALAYAQNSLRRSQLVWMNRTGSVEDQIGRPARVIQTPTLSPDGRRIAFSRAEYGNRSIWVHDSMKSSARQFTFGLRDSVQPTWSPDGRQIAFISYDDQSAALLMGEPGSGSDPKSLVEGAFQALTPDWSADGAFLVFSARGLSRQWNLWAMASYAGAPLTPALRPFGSALTPTLSPDGRYLAFASDRSGRWEVYVTAFPHSERIWRISDGGGVFPRWTRESGELFFVQGSTLMAAKVDTGGAFQAGAPAPVFTGDAAGARLYDGSVPLDRTYDVTPDGRRFVTAIQRGEDAVSLTIVRNGGWTSGPG